jgi:hypothetical protein
MKLYLDTKFTVGTFEDKATELNELVTLRGAAVGQQDDQFNLNNFITHQMQVTAESGMAITGLMSSLPAAGMSDESGVKDDGASASDTTRHSPYGIYIQITFF